MAQHRITIALTAVAASVALLTTGCSRKTAESTTSTAAGQSSTAPSGEQAAKAKVALVRFVNGVPGRAANLAFGDAQLFTDIAYDTVTPYKEVPGERHDFKLSTGRERGNAPVTNSEGLTDGARYTVVASLDGNGREKLDVINDDLSPDSSRAKLRVINASADKVDVFSPIAKNGDRKEGTADRMKNTNRRNPYANEDKWFSGVSQASSTTFKDIEPYQGKLDIVPAGDHALQRMATHIPVDLRAGQIYTVVVTGGTREFPLHVVKIEDQLNGAAPQHAKS